MKTGILILIALLSILFLNSTVNGQVSVYRGGEENPMVTIGKSTLYGAGTGVLLGLALSLVIDEDFEDVLKWSFVGGTVGGFLIGVVHVATRPSPGSALLQFDDGRFARLAPPQPQVRFNGEKGWAVQMNIVSFTL